MMKIFELVKLNNTIDIAMETKENKIMIINKNQHNTLLHY